MDKGVTVPQQLFQYASAGPGSATDIATATVWVDQVFVCNTTGGALTFTMADKAGTPVEVYTAKSIAANDVLGPVTFEPPLVCTDGININAAAGLDVRIQGRVRS
jgi:hypothetical protein